MNKLFLAITACLFSSLTFAAEDEFPGIETLMTTDELQASGVADLSPRQIEALNGWLEKYAAGDITAIVSSEAAVIVAPVREPASEITETTPADDGFGQAPERITINSRIAGEFNGWTGKTLFRLENGQVWEQRRGRRWKITLDNPEVRITQNFMGAYEMEVVSEGRSIGVRRIR